MGFSITALSPINSTRSALMLRLWEAISVERELPGVLATLADVLVPLMPFDSVGIIDFSTIGGKRMDEGPHQLIALHVVGFAAIEGESPEELAARCMAIATVGPPKPLGVVKPFVPYPPISEERIKGEPSLCDDLLEKEGWFDHEFHLAQSGIRSYATIPLISRGRLIAAAVFARMRAMPFSPDDKSTLW